MKVHFKILISITKSQHHFSIPNHQQQSQHNSPFIWQNPLNPWHSSSEPTLSTYLETGFIRFGHLQVALGDRNPMNNDYSISLYRRVRHNRPIHCGIPIPPFNYLKFVGPIDDKSIAGTAKGKRFANLVGHMRRSFQSKSHDQNSTEHNHH